MIIAVVVTTVLVVPGVGIATVTYRRIYIRKKKRTKSVLSSDEAGMFILCVICYCELQVSL